MRLPADVAAEILLLFPAKSVVRFRLVCTEWLSLSSDPQFLITHAARYPHPPASCLLIDTPALCRPLRGSAPCVPDPFFSFLSNRSGTAPCVADPYSSSLSLLGRDYGMLSVVSVCAGLVLVRDHRLCGSTHDHYVCNPTTKQWAEIPARPAARLYLAFDPSASPHYEIVAVEHPSLRKDPNFHTIFPVARCAVAVYSSRTGTWRRCDAVKDFPIFHMLRSTMHAFYRGSLFWLAVDDENLLVLDVAAEKLSKISLPYALPRYAPVPGHLGVSGRRLTVIKMNSSCSLRSTASLDVWELEPCGSEWSFVCAFVVDDNVAGLIANSYGSFPISSSGYHLSLVSRHEEGESGGGLLLIKHCGTVASYNLQDGSLHIIHKPFSICELLGDEYTMIRTISYSLSPLLPPIQQ